VDYIIFGNSVEHYLKGIGIFIAMALGIYFLLKLLSFILSKLFKRSKHDALLLLMKLDKYLSPVLQYFPIYYLTIYFNMHDKLRLVISSLWFAVLTFAAVRFLSEVVKLAITNYVTRKFSVRPTLINASIKLAIGLLYLFGLLFILANIGFNITTLITGLGVGGMAIALASQTILGDLFNYFTILIDRPFEIGDTIKHGDVYGEVVGIGIKGIRIKSSSGELVIVSNTEIIKGALRNFQAMSKRRVQATLGVLYSTSAQKMEEIPGILKDIVDNIEGVSFGSAHFREFGGFSLNFEFTYYVNSNSYAVYTKLQHLVNMEILRRFEKEGIVFAYPTQSVYVHH
jgi:small-conductance mechanosensitive channel